ncbi:hypothetical protein [Pandoravirus japonicus]|uniref:Uncharacterized protein n=1 Tax=Pandoravirus japonicus TaxID=2823154 RepID=A0A811BLX4_9VIRU|nr:hypothetical protein [Pandoravirus japonicus]
MHPQRCVVIVIDRPGSIGTEGRTRQCVLRFLSREKRGRRYKKKKKRNEETKKKEIKTDESTFRGQRRAGPWRCRQTRWPSGRRPSWTAPPCRAYC